MGGPPRCLVVMTESTKVREQCQESHTVCTDSNVKDVGRTNHSIHEKCQEIPSALKGSKCKGAANQRRSNRRLANRMGGGMLSSSMFDLHMGKLWRSFKGDNLHNFITLDCMWFFIYTEEVYKWNVLKWIDELNIFSRKYVFIPIVVWFMRDIYELGTMPKHPTLVEKLPLLVPKVIKQYIVLVDGNYWLICSVFHVFVVTNKCTHQVPQQWNDMDCEYFVLYYITKFVEVAPEDFSINDEYPYLVSTTVV
ncbi:uncharacterized protein LOC116142052 [Pistacia vera]|uniref:uncharacterized protein LOC116142052 n=1 Tax=Pistacia vera TaxID=55513 RepID=UPI0012638594|nr:uncharacterized protein LOC116142052 [Pistacia vera]